MNRILPAVFLIAIFQVCCVKIEPAVVGVAVAVDETQPISGPVPPNKEKVGPKSTRRLPQADADLELATELRDPNLLQQLEDPDSARTATTIKKNERTTNNRPIVIKGGESVPEIPQPKTAPPAPPIAAPSIPANDASTTKSPGAGR